MEERDGFAPFGIVSLRCDPMTPPMRPIERVSQALGVVVGSSPLFVLVAIVTTFWAKLTWTAMTWIWGLWP